MKRKLLLAIGGLFFKTKFHPAYGRISPDLQLKRFLKSAFDWSMIIGLPLSYLLIGIKVS